MEKRIISTQITEEDYGIENSLRPLSLDDYVGQNKVKSNLKVYIEAAKERGEALDHVLFMDLGTWKDNSGELLLMKWGLISRLHPVLQSRSREIWQLYLTT